MNSEARDILDHSEEAIGPAARAAVDAFAAELPPALVARFAQLVWTIDEGTAATGRAEQRRVDALVRAHLASGAWFDVLVTHCGGSGRDCCEHVEQLNQRLLPVEESA